MDCQLLLGPLLRHVGETDATVWVETSAPCEVTVLEHTTRTFCVRGRYYALVIIEGLEPGSTIEYDVEIDGQRVWPESGSELPPSVIRTVDPTAPVSVLAGSCRAAAPHEPPYTLELATNEDGRGVDTLWAHARRMVDEAPSEWPTLLLLVGDQIYADDSSPHTEDRIEQFRSDDSDLPTEIVATFEEYCWLYAEAWSPSLERWLLSVVPSIMIFDDHDMIDDWNISDTWLRDISAEPWWRDHAIGGIMSYWIYQHLGNQSPAEIGADGLLDELLAVDDGSDILERWAEHADANTPDEGGYRFSYTRTLGELTIIVIDSRNGRLLDPDHRRMVAEVEWAWVREQALDRTGAGGHVMFATTLPVFIADGLHDLQVWSELVCNGRWGTWFIKRAEKLRRSLDLEDWSAFAASYDLFVALVEDLVAADHAPDTVVVVSGDIHFSYTAEVPLGSARTRVHQVVSSPIRNALIPHERGAMRTSLTPLGTRIGATLRWLARGPKTAPHINVTSGPYFANNMCELHYDGSAVEVTVEHSTSQDDGGITLDEVARVAL
ncbi:MAG: hypothetical protein WBP59_15650 [Ilumatobacteraceae bacterium]